MINAKSTVNQNVDVFLDSEDDYVPSDQPVDFQPGIYCGHHGSGIEYLATTVFEFVSKLVVDTCVEVIDTNVCDIPEEFSISSSFGSYASTSANVVSESLYNSSKVFLHTVMMTPYKRLISIFVIRPFIVRIGVKASIQAELLLSKYRDEEKTIDFRFLEALLSKTETLSKKSTMVAEKCFERLLSEAILEQLLSKLRTTIVRCSFKHVVDLFLTPARNLSSQAAVSPIASTLTQCFLLSDRFSQQCQVMRTFLVYFCQIASFPQLLDVSRLWISAARDWYHGICLEATMRIPSQAEVKSTVESLVETYRLAQSISRVELSDCGLCHFAAERSCHMAIADLPRENSRNFAVMLARNISDTLNPEIIDDTSSEDKMTHFYSAIDFMKVSELVVE